MYMNEKNKNIRKKRFKEDELNQYVKNGDLKESDIKIILDYQKLLPVLQQEDGSWIDARMLHKELKVGKDFTNWIKGRISKYEFGPEVNKTLKVNFYHKYEKAIDKIGEADNRIITNVKRSEVRTPKATLIFVT